MFLGLTPEVWAQLWNGIFGAIIAGGSAALVAMTVLRKTNAHQTELARKEALRQETSAAIALAQQRDSLELQLKEQRDSLELQLKEQRQDASMEREIAARSELIGLVSDFTDADKSSPPDFDFKLLDRKIAITIQRWRINLVADEDKQLRSELHAWGGLFTEVKYASIGSAATSERDSVLGRALGDLQKAAVNYRAESGEATWTPAYTVGRLAETRQMANEFMAKCEAATAKSKSEWAAMEEFMESKKQRRRDEDL